MDPAVNAWGDEWPAHLTELGMVAVMDAPKHFALRVNKHGFGRVDTVKLDQLDYANYRVYLSAGASWEKMAQSLTDAFPRAIIDQNPSGAATPPRFLAIDTAVPLV